MNTKNIIGEAVGVQWQGLQDRTEVDIATSQTRAVIVGRFKRGILYKSMSINNSNIRSQLGYDPKNPDYIAVQDCLDAGVPNLNVVRIGKVGVIEGPTAVISCEGATNIARFYIFGLGSTPIIKINDVEVIYPEGTEDWGDFFATHPEYGIECTIMSNGAVTQFKNLSNQDVRMDIKTTYDGVINGSENTTISYLYNAVPVTTEGDPVNHVTFCLSPTVNIFVEFSDGAEIIDASSVVIIGSVLNALSGGNIELTISGTGSANVLTNVVVQSDLTFTTAALDLSGFDAGSDVTVTASKLNGSVSGFTSYSDMAMLPALVVQHFQLRVAEFPVDAPFHPSYEAWRPVFSGAVSVRVVGSPNGTTIDWGDGSTQTVITTTGTSEFVANHTYATPDHILTVTSDDYLTRIKIVSSSITEVISYGDLKAHNMRFAIDSLMYVPATFSSYVTDMTAFFLDCYALDDPNVSNYDTTNVTSLEFALGNCAMFNQPINWNTVNVTNMWGTFNSMLAFNQPVNHLNVSNVTIFLATFEGCITFNQTFGGWSTGSALNMERMIKGCTNFYQDLSTLCVSNITSYPTEFSAQSGISANNAYHPVWGTCPL